MSISLEKFSKCSEVSSDPTMLQPEQSLFGYFNTKLADSIIFQSQNIVTFLFSL